MISSNNSTDPYHDNSTDTVVFAAVLNVFILGSSCAVLEVLLRFSGTRSRVAPALVQQTAQLPGCCFGWARAALARTRDLDSRDVDAAVLIHFANLGFKFCLFASLTSCVLIPIYANGHGDAKGFDAYSISNLSADGARYWVVPLCAYLNAAVFMQMALSEWRQVDALRRRHLLRCASGAPLDGEDGHENAALRAQAMRSIIVESVPEGGTTQEREADVKRFFEACLGEGCVYSCVLQPNTDMAHKALKLRETTKTFCCFRSRNLEQGVLRTGAALEALQVHVPDNSVSPRAAPLLPGETPDNAAAAPGVQIFQDVQGRTLQAARLVQDAVPMVGGHSVSTAFVTFKRAADRVAAEQLLLSRQAGYCVAAAPVPSAMIWKNAMVPWSMASIREPIGKLLCLILMVFWVVPVSAIQAWANTGIWDWLDTHGDGAWGFLGQGKVMGSIVRGYLPVIALMALLKILPYILDFLSVNYERRKVKTIVRMTVLSRNLNFQLATLYVTVLSSSLWTTFTQILEEGPSVGLAAFSEAVPKVAVYFISLVLARTGTTMAILLLGPFFYAFGKPIPCWYEVEAADLSLMFTLGLTYCTIAPFMMPVCAAYFGMASLVYRWLFLCCYRPDIDCSGELWNDIFKGSMTGFVLGTLMLASITASKRSYASPEFGITLLLPGFVLLFLVYCDRNLIKKSRFMAMDDAREADAKFNETGLVASFEERRYFDNVCEREQLGLEQQDSFVTGT